MPNIPENIKIPGEVKKNLKAMQKQIDKLEKQLANIKTDNILVPIVFDTTNVDGVPPGKTQYLGHAGNYDYASQGYGSAFGQTGKIIQMTARSKFGPPGDKSTYIVWKNGRATSMKCTVDNSVNDGITTTIANPVTVTATDVISISCTNNGTGHIIPTIFVWFKVD